jgi:hypothetical protein
MSDPRIYEYRKGDPNCLHALPLEDSFATVDVGAQGILVVWDSTLGLPRPLARRPILGTDGLSVAAQTCRGYEVRTAVIEQGYLNPSAANSLTLARRWGLVAGFLAAAEIRLVSVFPASWQHRALDIPPRAPRTERKERARALSEAHLGSGWYGHVTRDLRQAMADAYGMAVWWATFPRSGGSS